VTVPPDDEPTLEISLDVIRAYCALKELLANPFGAPALRVLSLDPYSSERRFSGAITRVELRPSPLQ
jgi:hypothetical protein